MIVLTAKEYLNSVRNADKLIKVKKDELYSLRKNIAQISSQRKTEPVKNSSVRDPMIIIDKIVDLQNEINSEIANLVRMKSEVRSKINQLSDERYIIVLTEYYINQKTWEQVADRTHYDLRYVYKIHGKALKAFTIILNRTLKDTL